MWQTRLVVILLKVFQTVSSCSTTSNLNASTYFNDFQRESFTSHPSPQKWNLQSHVACFVLRISEKPSGCAVMIIFLQRIYTDNFLQTRPRISPLEYVRLLKITTTYIHICTPHKNWFRKGFLFWRYVMHISSALLEKHQNGCTAYILYSRSKALKIDLKSTSTKISLARWSTKSWFHKYGF